MKYPFISSHKKLIHSKWIKDLCLKYGKSLKENTGKNT